MKPAVETFALVGGLNLEDPQIIMKPGELSLARNIECVHGVGYRRVEGYERFDGQTSPSSATYHRLPFNLGGTTGIAVGDNVVGATSGTTTPVVAVVLTSGSWAGGDAVGELCFAGSVTAPYISGETLRVGGAYRAIATDADSNQARTDANYRTFLRAAQTYYRNLIAQIPGTGGVKPYGCCFFKGRLYAFRYDAASGTVKMYKSSGSSWTNVDLGKYIKYTNGAALINEGDTITGGTSGATAVVRRVNIAGGSYAGPTFCSGRLCIDTIVGVFTNGENLKVGGVTKAVANGTQGSNTLNPVGHFMEFAVHNFYGAANYERMYGVNGADPGFEFDGTYFIFNDTAMPVDAPTHVCVHKNHLFYSFLGGSIQNSGTTTPRNWSVRAGAADIFIGAEVTTMRSMRNDTMAVESRSTAHVLYGSDDRDWSLKLLTSEVGAMQDTCREVGGQAMFFNETGAHFLTPAQEYGNFIPNNVGRKVYKYVKSRFPMTGIATGYRDVYAYTSRRLSQYRVSFYQPTGFGNAGGQIELRATFYGAELVGWGMVEYPEGWTLTNFTSGNDTDGTERIFAIAYNINTGDAYAVEMDKGTSFDGANIPATGRLPFNYQKSPKSDKRFLTAQIENDIDGQLTMQVAFEFDYGSESSQTYDKAISALGGLWGVDAWATFTWGGQQQDNLDIPIDGVGKNVAPIFYHSDDLTDPYILQAMTLTFATFGVKR